MARVRDLDLIAVSVGARLVLGVFAGAVASFLGWITAFWAFKLVDFTPVTFPVVTVLAIGLWVALAVSLSWWHMDSPRRAGLVNSLVITLVSLVSSYIGFRAGLENSGFTWVERGIVFPMANASVLGANVVAMALHLYRVVVRREV